MSKGIEIPIYLALGAGAPLGAPPRPGGAPPLPPPLAGCEPFCI